MAILPQLFVRIWPSRRAPALRALSTAASIVSTTKSRCTGVQWRAYERKWRLEIDATVPFGLASR